MTKFEEFPINVQRIKASRRYQEMVDYQQAWYLNLLMEAWDSEPPGYLKDNGSLWQVANARTEAFFLKESGPVIACFQRLTMNGVPYLVNQRLLEIYKRELANSSKKKRSLVSLKLSISSDLSLPIYEKYPRKVCKKKALDAIAKAIDRVMREDNRSDAEAAKLICEAVEEFAQSPAGQRGTYTPHCATWMNQDRFRDEREEWYELDQQEFKAIQSSRGKPGCPKCQGSGQHGSNFSPGRSVDCECTYQPSLVGHIGGGS